MLLAYTSYYLVLKVLSGRISGMGSTILSLLYPKWFQFQASKRSSSPPPPPVELDCDSTTGQHSTTHRIHDVTTCTSSAANQQAKVFIIKPWATDYSRFPFFGFSSCSCLNTVVILRKHTVLYHQTVSRPAVTCPPPKAEPCPLSPPSLVTPQRRPETPRSNSTPRCHGISASCSLGKTGHKVPGLTPEFTHIHPILLKSIPGKGVPGPKLPPWTTITYLPTPDVRPFAALSSIFLFCRRVTTT